MKDWNALVEAEIYGIRVSPTQKEVTIDLNYAGSDTKASIFAVGVDSFVMQEMRIFNIVDRVQIWGLDDVMATDTANLVFFMLQGRSPAPAELEWPALQERLSLIRNGSLTLLEIEPVYGARILLLANNIELHRFETV